MTALFFAVTMLRCLMAQKTPLGHHDREYCERDSSRSSTAAPPIRYGLVRSSLKEKLDALLQAVAEQICDVMLRTLAGPHR